MPKGPRGEKRPADVIGAAVKVMQIANVKHGKYAGRVVADVLVGGERLSDMLVAEGLARPYHGGPARELVSVTTQHSPSCRPGRSSG